MELKNKWIQTQAYNWNPYFKSRLGLLKSRKIKLKSTTP